MTNNEALTVLAEVRAKLGRNYKAAIREAWITGDYSGQCLDQWAEKLQRIRNGFGPSWLIDARPATAPAPSLGTAGGVVIGPRLDLSPCVRGIYPEITCPNVHPTPAVVFPDKCPACGAAVVFGRDGGTAWQYVRYACGGDYASKPQIQNHTLKWWGKCGGKVYDQEAPITPVEPGHISDAEAVQAQACRIRDLVSEVQALLKACKRASEFLQTSVKSIDKSDLPALLEVERQLCAAIAKSEGR